VSVGLSLPVLISRGGARVLSVQLNHAEPESLKVSADNLKLSAIMARGTLGNRGPYLLDLPARKRRTRGWVLLSSDKSRDAAQRRRVR
jgi:hypothetical protein